MQKEIIEFNIPSLKLNIKTIDSENTGQWKGMHTHSAIEMVYVNCGALSCETDKEIITVTEGKVLFINSGTAHRLYSDGTISITYVQTILDEEKRNSMIYTFASKEDNVKYLVAERGSVIYDIFFSIKKEAECGLDYYREFIRSDLIRLAAYLHRSKIIASPRAERIMKIEKLAEVAGFIEENYSSEINLEMLAALNGCDKYSLCRKFKSATGATVIDYLNYVRLKNAERLLLYSDNNISEIAFMCGFSSIQYFNKVFKKYMGCTPGGFRK